jgi:carboxymethylenebutenolidase
MGTTTTLTAADGHSFEAYVAGPEDAKRGLVVIQEIFGLNHHIKAMVDRYAAHGYRVIAPAIFDRVQRGVELGYGPDDRKAGSELRKQVSDDAALADIAACAAALGDRKKAIIGYCYGGTMAWLSSTRLNVFSAASGWYGGGVAGTKDEKPSCAVQLHFGETDGAIPMSDVDAIKAAQPQAEVYVYPGAGHGFNCDERDSFNADACKLATERTLAFFEKNLG